MRSQHSSTAQDNSALMILAVCALLVPYALSFFDEDTFALWYYSNYWYFSAMNKMPDWVLDWIFFWFNHFNHTKPSMLIDLISKDLAFHANDYFEYYNQIKPTKIAQINLFQKQTLAVYTAGFLILYLLSKIKETANTSSNGVPIDVSGSYYLIKYWLSFKGVVYILFYIVTIPLFFTPQIKKTKERLHPVLSNDGYIKNKLAYRFIRKQSEFVWVYSKPFANICHRIAKTGVYTDWYAMAKMPFEWLKENDCLIIEKRPKRTSLVKKEKEDFRINERMCFYKTKENLGRLWNGLDDLTEYEKWVMALCIYMLNGKVSSQRILNRKICFALEVEPQYKGWQEMQSQLRKEINKEVEDLFNKYKEDFIYKEPSLEEFEDPYDPLMSNYSLSEEKDKILSAKIEEMKKEVGYSIVEDQLAKASYELDALKRTKDKPFFATTREKSISKKIEKLNKKKMLLLDKLEKRALDDISGSLLMQIEKSARDDIKDIVRTHAYVKTVLLAILERSWRYGVLSSSELKWIKVVNRDLWYVITQQGRLSCFAEASGCWAHFLSEKWYRVRSITPQLKYSIMAFDEDMYKTHNNYKPLFNHENLKNEHENGEVATA
jgi:hypothetical protein